MRNSVAALAAVLILAGVCFAADQQTTTIVVPEPATTAPTPAAQPVTSTKVSGPLRDFLQRRRLGVTFVNVARVVREMDAAGELDRDQPDGIALQVMARLQSENPEEFAKVMADRDWAAFFDALLAFLEKMLPLILTFM